MKKQKQPEKKKQPEPQVDDILIEGNRFTPYGALPEKNPEYPVMSAPVKTENPDSV